MLLRRLEAHFAGPSGWPTLERIAVRHGEVGVDVDYAALRGHCADSDLAIAMEMNPADALACIAAAAHEVPSSCREHQRTKTNCSVRSACMIALFCSRRSQHICSHVIWGMTI